MIIIKLGIKTGNWKYDVLRLKNDVLRTIQLPTSNDNMQEKARIENDKAQSVKQKTFSAF
jgi:hypothetical protein